MTQPSQPHSDPGNCSLFFLSIRIVVVKVSDKGGRYPVMAALEYPSGTLP